MTWTGNNSSTVKIERLTLLTRHPPSLQPFPRRHKTSKQPASFSLPHLYTTGIPNNTSSGPGGSIQLYSCVISTNRLRSSEYLSNPLFKVWPLPYLVAANTVKKSLILPVLNPLSINFTEWHPAPSRVPVIYKGEQRFSAHFLHPVLHFVNLQHISQLATLLKEQKQKNPHQLKQLGWSKKSQRSIFPSQ